MRPVDGKAKSVRQLLQGVKYSIDYYQREYRWEAKQIRELLNDLCEAFLDDYEPGMARSDVSGFTHYFLGSIIISQKGSDSFIVDGQQRLTSLTLLLILLRNLQRGREDTVKVDDLVFSERYGEKTFNLAVEERSRCMEALYEGDYFDTTGKSESVQNLHERYRDMESEFPVELRDEALPYFVDWLIDNVHLVEISAYSDEDAYTIFETMNDRGLSLSPTDMLKGYLLASMNQSRRAQANEMWRGRVQQLSEKTDDHGADFFKTWLRSQYATRIRERRKGATPEDFERIGSEFHRWVRDKRHRLELNQREDFFRFVDRDFDFYSRQYLKLRDAEAGPVPGLEHVFYNSAHGFTLQDMLLLSPLRCEDSETTVACKMRLVSRFVDILITRRIWNFRSIAYSTMQYAMFLVMRNIRGLSTDALAEKLYETLTNESEDFHSNDRLRVHQQNRYALHRLLARMTDYVETQSGQKSRYLEYIAPGKNRYEIEHVWADHAEQHRDEFAHVSDFEEQRNRIGGLLLLPRSFNASYGDLPYEDKLPHYNSQNLLARSLHPLAYDHNPGFINFVRESGLPFCPHKQFKREDIKLRGELYGLLAERIWDPDLLLKEVS